MFDVPQSFDKQLPVLIILKIRLQVNEQIIKSHVKSVIQAKSIPLINSPKNTSNGQFINLKSLSEKVEF